MEVKELSDKWDKYAEAQEAHRKAVDERIAKLEKGESTADVEAKLAKANEAMTALEKEVKELVLKSQRPAAAADEKGAAALEAFNRKGLAAAMEAGRAWSAMSADGYTQYKQAMARYLRKDKDGLTADEFKAINVGTSPMGGYLLGEEMEAGIDRVLRRYSAMREVATVRAIGQAVYKKLVKVTGTSGSTKGNERTAPAEGTAQTWSELEFKTGTYLSDQRATLESLEDAVIDVEADLIEEIGIEFAEKEGQDFIDGDGTNGPRGILDYSIVANASYAWGKVGYIASGAAAAFATSNPSDALIDLQHALRRQFRPGAVWTMNDATLGTIRKFKDGQGNYLWGMTRESFMAGAVGTLLGHPVVTDDFMQDVGANKYPIAFGDFKRAYYVVDRKGMAILRDPFSAYPQVAFKTRKRVGGGIANFEALKLLKIAAS